MQRRPYVHNRRVPVRYCLFHYGKRTLIVGITTALSCARFLSVFLVQVTPREKEKRKGGTLYIELGAPFNTEHVILRFAKQCCY